MRSAEGQDGNWMLSGPVPIPPLSVVRLSRADRQAPNWRRQTGRIFRVGYYSRMDGLNCIWLVNDEGEYEQATNHEFLYRYFDIVQLSNHKNWYGRRRPRIPPITRAVGWTVGGTRDRDYKRLKK